MALKERLTYSAAWENGEGTSFLPATVESEEAARSNLQVQHSEARDKINEIVDAIETSVTDSNEKLPTSRAVKNAITSAIADVPAQIQSDWNQTNTSAKDYIKNKPSIPSSVTIDSELSSSSENPVQNKVIKTALDGKAASDHVHPGVPVVYLDGTALTGTPKITLSPSDPSGGSDGEIWFKYEE